MASATTSVRLVLAPRTPSRLSPLICGLRSAPLATPLCPRRRQQHQALPSQPVPSTRRTISSFLASLLPTSATSPHTNGSPHPPQPAQTLHARRMLPYSPAQLYTIIADIDSYRFFLPNCTASQVTAWTSPSTAQQQEQEQEQQQKRWPALADLTVGWGPFTQSYTSRVYCIPGSVVEAVSGAASTTIAASTLAQARYDISAGEDKSTQISTGIFQSLVTRWTVRAAPAPQGGSTVIQAGVEWAEVELSIQYRFANPALGFAVGQLADEKVNEMVQAFEERARRLYGKKK